MAKRCPSCGYGPIGPFTDNCPICAEPVRNVRSSGGSFGGGSFGGGMPPWVKWLIGGVVFAVVAVVGCCGLGVWRMNQAVRDAQQQMVRAQAQAEADRRARTVVVTAADLAKEFEADPAAAEEKYGDKYLEVTGVVERTGTGRGGVPFIILHAGDEAAKVKIECHFDTMDQVGAGWVRRLAAGQTVTVRGEYDGRVSNVQLRECVLLK